MDNIPAGAQLLPPPTLAERHEINELMRSPRAYTHLVSFDKKGPHIGTAFFLRDGERLFAFTAAHNIHDNMAIQFRLRSDSKRTEFDILSTYTHPRYDPKTRTSKFDLAILELEPNTSVAAGDVSQLYTGAFGKLPEGEYKATSNAFVWVVGYPSELARPRDDRTVLEQTPFATQILDYADDEMSLHYPETVYQMPHDGTTCEVGKTTPTPSGYSGGGLWVNNYRKGDLFDPHRHIKVVGVQTHWSPSTRRIFCVPSKVVAEAFKEFKSGLR